MEAVKAFDEKVLAYGISHGDPNLIDSVCKYYEGLEYSLFSGGLYLSPMVAVRLSALL